MEQRGQSTAGQCNSREGGPRVTQTPALTQPAVPWLGSLGKSLPLPEFPSLHLLPGDHSILSQAEQLEPGCAGLLRGVRSAAAPRVFFYRVLGLHPGRGCGPSYAPREGSHSSHQAQVAPSLLGSSLCVSR